MALSASSDDEVQEHVLTGRQVPRTPSQQESKKVDWALRCEGHVTPDRPPKAAFLNIQVKNRADFRPDVLRSVLIDNANHHFGFRFLSQHQHHGAQRLHLSELISRLTFDEGFRHAGTKEARYVLSVVSQTWRYMVLSGHSYGIITSDSCALILKNVYAEPSAGLDAEFIICDVGSFELLSAEGTTYTPSLAEIITIVGILSLETGLQPQEETIRLAKELLALAGDSYKLPRGHILDIPSRSMILRSDVPRDEAFPENFEALNALAAEVMGPAPPGFYHVYTPLERLEHFKYAMSLASKSGYDDYLEAMSELTPRFAIMASAADFVQIQPNDSLPPSPDSPEPYTPHKRFQKTLVIT